jgi:hypothetical protein
MKFYYTLLGTCELPTELQLVRRLRSKMQMFAFNSRIVQTPDPGYQMRYATYSTRGS